ncbi:MAG: hypothetical protein BGO66_10350 [Alicycliphilus sp. 69-12]|nr:MAG: hypothetical protein BGO66_10350 [Alicycliphilus sp. 69-12]
MMKGSADSFIRRFEPLKLLGVNHFKVGELPAHGWEHFTAGQSLCLPVDLVERQVELGLRLAFPLRQFANHQEIADPDFKKRRGKLDRREQHAVIDRIGDLIEIQAGCPAIHTQFEQGFCNES